MSEKRDASFALTLAKDGSYRRVAENNLFEVMEESGVRRREKEEN